ncbi:MAG: transposase [Pseudohongiellaceae bacterium]
MTLPRAALVSAETTPYYHCICRCVRRAFLCGQDPYSGRSFEHRRLWVCERLALLTEVFAIDLCAYALMSNHYHLVVRLAPERVQTWSDVDVVTRWTRVFAGPALARRFRDGGTLTTLERQTLDTLIAQWRERLGNLSWFMRCLNEAIARQANAEDDCTGRFWEGRFKTQALLDEQALLTAMVYVDLNPLRAGIATAPEDADFTSLQARWYKLTRRQVAPHPQPALLPFRDSDHRAARDHLPFNWPDYLELVETTGHRVLNGKRTFAADTVPSILTALGLDPAAWFPTVTNLQARFELVIGAPRRLRLFAAARGRHWVRGRAAALALYLSDSGADQRF